MSRILGLVLAGGLLLGSAATTQAQVGISIGNPYAGRGVYIGAPAYGYGGYGYNSGYSGYGYNSGYSGYGYNSAYSGLGYGRGIPAYGYAAPYRTVYAAPAYAYPRYGYGGYGYNRGIGIGGFRPFRRW